ncbi:MAG: hypothetical protein PVI30_04250 [Myxococcales bacterium]
MKRARTPNEAIVEPSGGPAYEGKAGQTRTERVHLVEPDGSMRSVEVHRVVNVGTHPELKTRVLAGELHVLDDGRELAIPYVYHDPTELKFALVVPPALAHLEMKEWSRLMAEIAEDTSAPVPAYVRDSVTVLGLGALEILLEEGSEADEGELSEVPAAAPDPGAKLREQQHELEERERELRRREQAAQEQHESLSRLASDLTEREARIKRRDGEITKARKELERRKRELEARAREQQEHAHDADVVPDGEWQEISGSNDDQPTVLTDMTRYREQHGEPLAGAAASDAVGEVRDVDEADVQMVESAPPSAGLRPAAGAAPRGGDEVSTARPPSRSSRPPGPRSEPTRVASREAARSAAQTAPRPAPTPAHPSRDRTPAAPRPAAAASKRPSAPPPVAATSVPPPPPRELTSLPSGRMLLREDGGELWVLVPLSTADASAFRQGVELLVQLTAHAGHPVVVFTLVDAAGQAVRAAYDAADPRCDALLSRLERSYRARIAFYLEGELRDVQSVSALRESVVRAVREHLAGQSISVAAQPVAERVLASPPPARDDGIPFTSGRVQTRGTADVFAAVQALETWTEPDRMQLAVLRYSVPRHVVEASTRRVLRSAHAYGIALSPRLTEQAVKYAVASSPEALVRDQLAAFRKRIERGDNDLDAAGTLQNWKRLFSQADALGVEVGSESRMLADAAAADAGMRPLSSMLPPRADLLQEALADPGRRLQAIDDAAREGHVAAIGPICEALETFSPEEVAHAVGSLLRFGERAGDGLIAGLGARSQFVRQACALALGRLRLLRALPPLVRQLQSEPTDSYGEIARAIGELGAPAVESLAAAFASATRPERLMLALAHAANHGAADEVESLENSTSEALASAARQAAARRARMGQEDRAVRGGGTPRDNSPETHFSQAFYARLGDSGG